MRRSLLLSLVGSAILAGFSVAALPFSHGLFRAPRTPYGANEEEFGVRAWILLSRAEPLIPRGVSVLVRLEPPEATNDSYAHRFAVGLLPGRRIVPAALWSVATPPDLQREAEYEVVIGGPPLPPPGRLLLETPLGSVWRRER